MPQSLSNVAIHLVFSTKHRHQLIADDVRHELHRYMSGVLRNHGCQAIQVGGVKDHVHLLFPLSRSLTTAQVVEKVKTSSSKWMKTHRPDFAWQAGYGAFSVGQKEIEATVRYIQNQEVHHRKMTFQEEYRELLSLAGIAWDEQYVWD
jgi:putative transposase